MRVIVIGAGFAGCCAALLLREALSAEVTVLEREHEPGGMLRTLRTPEGAAYEYGPRVVSVFRGTPGILPFLRRYLVLEERDVYHRNADALEPYQWLDREIREKYIPWRWAIAPPKP